MFEIRMSEETWLKGWIHHNGRGCAIGHIHRQIVGRFPHQVPRGAEDSLLRSMGFLGPGGIVVSNVDYSALGRAIFEANDHACSHQPDREQFERAIAALNVVCSRHDLPFRFVEATKEEALAPNEALREYAKEKGGELEKVT